MTLARASEPRFISNRNVQTVGGFPKDGEGPSAAIRIPDTRGHESVIDGDAGHLLQAHNRLVHEVNYELRQSRIEGLIIKGEPFCCRPSHVRQWIPFLHRTGE